MDHGGGPLPRPPAPRAPVKSRPPQGQTRQPQKHARLYVNVSGKDVRGRGGWTYRSWRQPPQTQSKCVLWTLWSCLPFCDVCIRSALVSVVSQCHVAQGGCVCWESEQISCFDQYGVNLNRLLSGFRPPHPTSQENWCVCHHTDLYWKPFPLLLPQSAEYVTL